MNAASAQEARALEFRLLGPLEVRRGGEVLALGPRKQRALLALLLVNANQVVSSDRLIEELWAGAPPPGAQKTLRSYLSRLRTALGAETLKTRPPGYELALETGRLDSERFQALFAKGRDALAAGDAARAHERLSEALALWRGGALADLADELFARAEAARLEELRLACVEERIEASLELGRHAALVGELGSFVQAQPLRERPHGQLMLALYRSGRQADALAAYRRFRALLADELGLEPSEELRALEQAILRHEVDRPLPASPAHNLPAPLTSFVGRERELVELERLLDDYRLVTLTGLGGCGKTRLALELAARALERFSDGVRFVELAPLSDPRLVAHELVTAIGISAPSERRVLDVLADHLRTRQSLIVLDNCEHVLEVVTAVCDELLRKCPNLSILTTSREALALTGERRYDVLPLAVPAVDADPDEALRSEAVRLFLERASAAGSASATGPASITAVARICRELDGLPLALELAAARARALTPVEIADRLDDRFRFLRYWRRTPEPRHQTLEAAMDWSYHLLRAEEQALLRGLSVFVGGFTREASAAVCLDGDSATARELLEHLVEASLVVPSATDGATRYHLLETVRQYGAARLVEARDEEKIVRERHASYFLALAEEAEPQLTSRDQVEWLGRLDAETDNFRGALRLFRNSEEQERVLRLAGSLFRFWYVRGYLAEGANWLAEALDADAGEPTAARAKALGAAAALEYRRARYGNAKALNDEAIAACRAIGDRAGIGRALNRLADVAEAEGDLDAAETLWGESADIAREVGNRFDLAVATGNLGSLMLTRGDASRAVPFLEQGLALFNDLGHLHGAAIELENLGQAALRERRYTDAVPLLTEALVLFRRLRAPVNLAQTMDELAAVVAFRGDARAAAAIIGAVERLFSETGGVRAPDMLDLHTRAVAAARDRLGDDAFDAARSEGAKRNVAEAVAYVLANVEE